MSPGGLLASRPRLLAIVPAEFDALQRKGVLDMLFERDEGGFFERVVTVHPATRETRRMELTDVHILYEFGFGRLAFVTRRRFLRWFVFTLHFLGVIPSVIALARDERVSLVRAHDPYWMGLLGYIVSRVRHIPFCVSIHADYEKRHELSGGGATYTFFGLRGPARMLSRFVLSRASLIMPIRRSLGEWAVANGARNESVRVIPHGLHMEPFAQAPDPDLRARLGLAADKSIVSFVGRPSRENYIYEVLETARLLAAKRRDFLLVLAGGGDEEECVREQIRGDDLLRSAVVALGFQPRTDCIQLRMISAVSLCPMGGFSLIEACAAGSPVVSYDVEWHAELVQPGNTGFLVREHDVAGMAQAVEFCLDNPQKARTLGANARRLAWERHDIRNASAAKRSAYAELLRCGND